uniref:Putative ovule protein n=1 Tax=Solanum chacoense TaxID=4108 RepID=A0A0V0HZ00_SOLCH
MCWAFEVVPFLQKKYKVFSKQVSSPRIFRWLLATNNELVDINELFDPPQDSIVHPWIIPTSSEMEMEFFTKFVPKKLTKDDKIEKLEIDLNGVVAIKRDIIIDEHNLDVGGGGASSPIFERVFSGVGDGGGGEFTPNVDRCTGGVDFERGGDFGDISGGFGVGTSSPIDENVPCLQETPSTKETIDLLNVRVESLEKTIVTMNAKIESLEKAIVTMKSKRGIRPSSKISHPYTPDYVKRTKRQISKALSSARKKKKGKVNETIIEKELVSGDSKDEGADIADEEADSNSKRS